MKKTAIAALLVVCLCLLPGCEAVARLFQELGPTNGPGCAQGQEFDTLEEFMAVFGETVALPTYYPEGFDPRELGDGKLDTSAYYTEEAFKNQLKADFDKLDASNYAVAGVSVSWEELERLQREKVSVFIKLEDDDNGEAYYKDCEEIPNHPYGAKVLVVTSRNAEEGRVIKTAYKYNVIVHMVYDEARYTFSFFHSIDSNAEEGRKYDLEEELKEWTIKEATLMYESMEYWK